MKKLFSFIFCIFFWINAWSQQSTVVGTVQKTQYENTSYLTTGTVTLKSGFRVNATQHGNFYVKAIGRQPEAPSEGQNFVREETIYKSGITTDDQVLGLSSSDKSTAFNYSDGRGRSLQAIAKQASPTFRDLISPYFYDSKGRHSRSHLPFRAVSANGGFRPSALTEQSTFYATPPVGIPADTRPYGETVFEDSPLERVVSSKQPGSAYSATSTSSLLKVNLANSVRKWTLVNGIPRSTTTYPAGTLTITESIDEKGFTNRVYTDFSGKKILSQSQLTASTWLDTYFVYNGFGELLYVIPPEASTTYSPTQTYADLWCFQYEYDNLGRSIGSKTPGAEWLYVIYDRWDRPVLTQDGEQRIKTTPEWTYHKYDIHNRPVITGVLSTDSTRAALTTAVANSTVRDEVRNTTAVGHSLNKTYPTNAAESGVLSIVYYDDYGFLSNSGWSPDNSLYSYSAQSGYAGTRLTSVKGEVTGSKSRTQGNSVQWTYSVSYYDTEYRVLQTVSSHLMGGTVKTVNQYAFSGEVQKAINIYVHSSGTTQVARRYTYDHAGRPLKVYHKVNSNEEVMLADYTYTELGNVLESKHHSRNNGNSWLYRQSGESTIQGRAKKVQYYYSNGTSVFSQELAYENSLGTGNVARHDGIISGATWKHYSTAPEQSYNYTYDVPKRLTASAYKQKANGSSTWSANNFWNESGIIYDKNGNIKSLTRNGAKSGSAQQIDNLTYTYSGNLLTSVSEGSTSSYKGEGFSDGNLTGVDYEYNKNGFLKVDRNKGITAITYTRHDLPQQVTIGGNTIRYTYSPSGNLLTVQYSSPSKTIQYVGELVFENGTLTDIKHEFGRVRANEGYRYQYYLSDYLGNTRVVLQEDPAVFTSTAGFETLAMDQEAQEFIGYEEAVRIQSREFNHTSGLESSFATRLSGGYGGNQGLAKAISVLPGDTVRMEVFGKYVDLKEAKSNPAIMTVLMGLAGGAGLVEGLDGSMLPQAKTLQGNQGLSTLMSGKENRGDAPPAYLNYLFFDGEMNYQYGGFVQMSEAAWEDGTNRAHERLYQEVVAEQPGYFYIYLSNDSPQGMESEAFFDDFSIQTSESYIVQTIDYYPYGLMSVNNVRTGDKPTKELFQGKTYDELTKWYDFHARQYDPALGRWFGLDPKAGVMPYNSPFSAMMNNPGMFADPDGECPICVGILVGALIGAGSSAAIYTSTYYASGNGGSGQFWNGFGKAVGMGAVTGAIGGGIGAAFANSAFAQSVGFSVLNNTGSTIAGNLVMGNDISVGTVLGGIGGGFAGMGLPQFSGVKGGVLANIGAEIGYGAVRGAGTGAVTGGIAAGIDGKNIGKGIVQGAFSGAIGGATLAGLNIASMGPSLYSGSNEKHAPVFRSGGLLTLHLQKGEGITLGRNLIVKEIGNLVVDAPLRIHEYTHFLQQRELGFGNFYARILGEYYQAGLGDGKWYGTYDTPGHLEYKSSVVESFFRYQIQKHLTR
ncbi:RHS repeat-associated protein [Algoriphagus sp. 4150]|uniref:DUF6443 domain-containing protein n=1 Tax=Algoriphagus sp. 4150 TaxID=2817756 RepID=UPI00285C7090|nr:DUF6443 domain-containing protein [Algoriphagus sp. 4150]MDR7131627.1 RHS repeat-associated protein [Algoriphagus sp. 4150]